MNTWLERKKASLCLLMALCILSLCAIIVSEGKILSNNSDYYSVTIRHYGVDAAEMERSITIPLEDALSVIPGVIGMQSSTENSMSRVFVRFNRPGHYDAMRDAAQRVYESLPQSVQRPQILSSDSSRIPVWSAVIANDESGSAFNIEKIIKPRLESLEGAGEVLISGTGLHELVITLDQEKAAMLGLVPSAVAAVVAMNDALFPGGLLIEGGRQIIVTVDGRYGTQDSPALSRMPIPLGDGRSIALGEVAVITEQERRPDSFSRINGKRSIGIAVMAGSNADLGKLSANIGREIADPSLPFEFTVLSDRGAEESDALRSVFSAALQGALMVAIISFILNRRRSGTIQTVNHGSLFCALSVPAVCLISAAILSACGFPLNRAVLAGLAAGIGTAVDSVILCSARLKRSSNYSEARVSLRSLYGPLIAGAATTVVVLLPIPAMGSITTGHSEARIIASAIAAVTIVSLILSIGLLPPLLLWGIDQSGKMTAPCAQKKLHSTQRQMLNRILRKACRFFTAHVRFCVLHPRIVVTAALVISIAGLTALCIRGAVSGSYSSGNSVYAHVEFAGGLLAEETDMLLAAFAEQLSARQGIVNVETMAKTGTGSVMISFDPKTLDTGKVIDYAHAIPIPGAFLFFPETTAKERHWEIKVFGDDSRKCRQIAEEMARSLSASALITAMVLNFKQGRERIDLYPDRQKLSALDISFFESADSIRRSVHGPVAYKKITSQGEIDVRFQLGGNPVSKNQVITALIPLQPAEARIVNHVDVGTLFTTEESYEPSSIRREDRRRTASITITTRAMDPRRVKTQIMPLLADIDLPAGYSIAFDPDAVRQAEALSKTVLYFLLALLFCYMVLGAVNESFIVPLVILFAVPPSLAVPALCLAIAGFPFNAAAACAFIAVSGMTVNASVLCTGGLSAAIQYSDTMHFLPLYLSLRRKLPALIAITATTIAGAVPFLFLREGANILVKTMALVAVLGVGTSAFSAISVIPASLILLRKKSA